MRERLAALLLEVDGTSGGYGGGDGWMPVEICLNILHISLPETLENKFVFPHLPTEGC